MWCDSDDYLLPNGLENLVWGITSFSVVALSVENISIPVKLKSLP